MTAIFVSGSGTDVGKTFVTTGLIRHLRREGRTVEAIKPVVSGLDPQALAESDPGALLSAMDLPVTLAEIERISPWHFAAPLSPDMAAEHEGRAIDFRKVVAFCQDAIAARRGHLFIEGIGGIMVPLDQNHTVLDLMTELRRPLLLVTGTYVGTISHTLTALQVLARRNLELAAIVVSERQDSVATLKETVATLARFSDSIDVIGIPRLAPPAREHPAFAAIARLL
jgi:dethiobiotin synthetase